MELRQRRKDAGPPSPEAPADRRRPSRSSTKILGSVLLKIFLVFFVVYVVIPAFFYCSSWLRQQVVFLTFVNFPLFQNLTNPESFGLYCPRYFTVMSEPSVELGAWYIPPITEKCNKLSPMFEGDQPIVLYLHGNSGSRGGNHRVNLYKVLTTESKVHVVTFDYRGYGDSSTHARPSVDGLVSDAFAMYQFLRETVPGKRIVIYGHSLGTGVATHLLEKLNELHDNPAALILESPFDKISNVVKRHPLGHVHRPLPYYQWLFVDPIHDDPITNFDSGTKSQFVNTKLPVMILHAKDDVTIPFDLGEELYRKFEKHRKNDPKKGSLKFVAFEADRGYGHKYICTHKGIGKTFRDFIDAATKSNVKLNA